MMCFKQDYDIKIVFYINHNKREVMKNVLFPRVSFFITEKLCSVRKKKSFVLHFSSLVDPIKMM